MHCEVLWTNIWLIECRLTSRKQYFSCIYNTGEFTNNQQRVVFQIDDNVLWHVLLLKNNVVPFYGMKKYNNTTKTLKLDNDNRI
jgi:hypothetical protein